ncbi:hypothetical protein EZS27_022602, partial [termite gut metagenome]
QKTFSFQNESVKEESKGDDGNPFTD